MNAIAKIRLFFIISLACVGFFSCDPNEELPPELILEYIGVQRFGVGTQLDSISLQIRFQKGDGNVGLFPYDTIYPFVGKYRNNFFIYTFDKVSLTDTIYEHFRIQNTQNIDLWDTLYYRSRIPILNNSRTESVKGRIEYGIGGNYVRDMREYSKHGVVRFEIYMYDRDLVRSNKIITPDIFVR